MTSDQPAHQLEGQLEGYRPQKPYPNGVTLWRGSRWGGNGFGNIIRLKAVYDGRVIGEYSSETHFVASSLEGHGDGEFAPDMHPTPRGMITVKSRYLKWLDAVKAWRPA